MKRRNLPVAATLAVTAALLLTACGGGDDGPEGNDKVPGADTGDSTPSASPSSSAPDGAGRPNVILPNGVKDVFESWKTGDATKDTVLADAARARTALNYAATQGNTKEPALSFYWQGDAFLSAVNWVKWFTDHNSTYIGTIRYFDARVTVSSGSSAAVIYCSDESKAYNKDKKTQKVDKTATTDKSYVLYNTHLEKSSKGVWETVGIVSKRGDKSCVQ
ncbi:hypothetical protein AB0G54_10660 [Streptomyces yokosukanensis]|uniref:hypothetical protein n=1 Tax=Streptomyces yokosukanensis TaxID=67386 RepID=UPI00344AB884